VVGDGTLKHTIENVIALDEQINATEDDCNDEELFFPYFSGYIFALCFIFYITISKDKFSMDLV